MRKVRIIPRLDIKYPNLIKGINLEGFRIVGNPGDFANEYYQQGADELLYMDIVASLYERNTIHTLIKKTAQNIFIPLTVGGGIRTVEDARLALLSGADKIAINTSAIRNPSIIKEISESFGSQCVVVSIEAKKISENVWEAYCDNGREHTGFDVLNWVDEIQKLGAGEILITSIDQEGTLKGFDTSLIQSICSNSDIPVIASGGMGSHKDLEELIAETTIDAVAIAHMFHYKLSTIKKVREVLKKLDIEVRTI
jgi:cyclase